MSASENTEATASANTPAPKQYSLNATLEQKGDEYIISVITDLNMKGSYGGIAVYGEGHVHFYVNGSLIGPITNMEPYPVSKYLVKGENKIILILAGNNHSQPYNAKKELTINIK